MSPLPFGLYRFLAKSFLQQSFKEFVFGQTFMVILLLGIYWLTFSFVNGNSSLFPGDNQYDRFRKLLQRANGLEIIKNELSRRSLDPNNLGTHSMRKGAATYCSSGSTAGPSSSSIHLRAGWAMNLSYEAAGDMFVGRVVAGLSLDKPEFDVIGPTFIGNSKFVMDAVNNIFKSIPDSLIAIGEKALASLVFHSRFLGPRADAPEQEEPDQPAAFQCWMIPDSIAGTTALRYCGTSDFDDANKKRRFGDLAKLMKSIENVAREKGIFNALTQLNQMMTVWEEEIGISTVTPKGRTRRVGQLKWRTVLN